jgi:hypothetical protein
MTAYPNQNLSATNYNNPYTYNNYNNVQPSSYSPYTNALPANFNYNMASTAALANCSPGGTAQNAQNPVFGYLNANPGYGISTGFVTNVTNAAATSVKGCKSILKKKI